MDNSNNTTDLLTFGGHLELLRKMLLRILISAIVLTAIIFCFKERIFSILLAPKSSGFVTFRYSESLLNWIGLTIKFEAYNIKLINTELSSQFLIHLSTSFMLGMLITSPYITFELFRFISPALYKNEKKNSALIAILIYALFMLGVMMSYYILFPISFRFLATYQVDPEVVNTITLDSYISTFTSLTFLMGIVFELPIIIFVLGKRGLIDSSILKRSRPYALVVIMTISAIITPPDIFTLLLVSVPLYGLYEISILILFKSTNYAENNIDDILP